LRNIEEIADKTRDEVIE